MPGSRNRLIRFFAYNNAVPIVFSIFFLSVSAAAASTPQVQEAVVQKNESVRSVDNSYIRTANLDVFEVTLTIESITESEFSYEVTYSYNSIGLEDFVWQPITKRKTLTVTKDALGDRDLGLYVAEQLGQIVSSEQKYLKEAQIAERALGSTQKVVVTEYAGLIGKHLKPQAQVFDGYTPVVEEVVESDDEPDRIAAGVGSQSVPKPKQEVIVQSPQQKPVEEQVKEIIEDNNKEKVIEDDQPTTTSTPPGSGTSSTTPQTSTGTATTTSSGSADTATSTPESAGSGTATSTSSGSVDAESTATSTPQDTTTSEDAVEDPAGPSGTAPPEQEETAAPSSEETTVDEPSDTPEESPNEETASDATETASEEEAPQES